MDSSVRTLYGDDPDFNRKFNEYLAGLSGPEIILELFAPNQQLTFDDIDAILEEELTEAQKQRRRESGYYEG